MTGTMSLRVAVQMDPPERLNLAGDSTYALLAEAVSRGHDIFYYRPEVLAYEAGRLSARGAALTVHSGEVEALEPGEERAEDLSSFDVVLMRQDPPFDMAYITATHLLEEIHPRTLVVNDPAEVRNAPEKLFVNRFAQFMPPTLISRDVDAMQKFRDAHRDIIIKPLYGNGGAGVFRVAGHDENFAALIELFLELGREPFIAQEYRAEVRAGDKRIILVDGEVAGAINRVPAEGDARSNMHAGGRPEPTELTAREREICAAIGPELARRGLIFVGIDVIGDFLTEINVTSPTGIREVKRFGGADIAALIWDAIERRLGA
jgi:glutathione synthase